MNKHPHIPQGLDRQGRGPEPQIHLRRPIDPWGLAGVLICAASAAIVVLGVLFAIGVI